MSDQRVEGWPTLGGVNARNGRRIAGVGAQAVDGLGREGDQPACGEDFRCGGDALRIGFENSGHGVESLWNGGEMTVLPVVNIRLFRNRIARQPVKDALLSGPGAACPRFTSFEREGTRASFVDIRNKPYASEWPRDPHNLAR